MREEQQSSVLIVDDNTKNLKVLADILRDKKYKVAMVKDGRSALDFIARKKPDIVLLDIMMPGMNGFEVCRQIKAEPSVKDIPVIFISALSDSADKVKAFEAGGVDYITKPFRKEEIFARVNIHLKLKHAREELLQSNELLRSANATKDRLFSVIAHDLRSPLASLSQTLDMMVTHSELFDEDRRTAFMNELRASAGRICMLLEDLLYWARSQQGETVCRPSVLDIAQLVERSVRLLSSAAEAKSIRLYSEIKAPVTVFADADMVMTVIRNLISNALKFTPESGEIRISAVSDGKTAEISVSDTGVGISKENINRLFRSDETFSTSGTRNEKGVGFGLMLCKEFAEKNRGSLRAESTEGTGSVFVFTLPAVKDET